MGDEGFALLVTLSRRLDDGSSMKKLRIPASIAGSAVATAAMRAVEGSRPDALFDNPLAQLVVTLADEVPDDDLDYLADGVNTTSLLTRMMVDYVMVRSHFFDTHLRAAATAGVRQIVLIGSGLDGRAFRMDWPPGTRIFEIDSAEIHAFKDELLARARLPPTADRVKVIGDATGEWRDALAAAGFDDTQPSSWLLEGLLFYLDPPLVRRRRRGDRRRWGAPYLPDR
ncbi:SAM-dependent methyltransferase [Amycolatopsis sp. NPDC051061]|uniref:SAM-dependent methyltransferase n=1 Tax=Amycolatopsis sp. NPDC051061 TaxID=3155042 RepID=UPI003424737E